MDREQRIDGLVKKILSGESSLIYELWRELDDLCGWYCRKLLRQLPDAFKLEFEDLYNCGFIALCDALQHCTLENHAGFSTYYLFYLTGTIMQENRLTKGGYYKDGRRRFDPIITGGTLSLDAPTDESQDNPETLYNLLSDEQAPYSPADMADRIIDRIYNQQLHDILEELIAVLPEQQQFVIRQKYYEGANCLEIAEYMGVKRSRVYALEDQALLRLRKEGLAVGLGQFLNDEINCYAGTGINQFKQSGSSSTERLAQKRIDLEARFARIHNQNV